MPALELASPLTLLEESEPVGEALFLTYGAQLGFFERFALAAARNLGARVSVIGDAARVSIDVSTVRRAGLRYLDGRVELAGKAFHPKLVVLAGAEDATVAIGSANVTLGGWHGNAEIWSVLRASSGSGPRSLQALASFLSGLPSVVSAGPGVEEALERSANHLSALATEEEDSVVVHSLAAPIIDQLPQGPVDELHLHAPFYDEGLEALAALCERLDPRRLDVYVHPETSVKGPLLERFLEARGAEWHSVDESRFHHGKLIEWVTDGRRFALTGSPNLSAPALLAPADDGGNVELGLITELEASLVPKTSPGPRQPLSENRIVSDHVSAAGLLLLGSVVEQHGVRIVLGRPLAQEVTVEIYVGEDWVPFHTVPRGMSEAVAPWPGTGGTPGTALRLRASDGALSNVVFITDLGAVTRPQIERVGRTQTSPTEIFSDLAIARAFAEDLARLEAVLARGRDAGVGGGGGDGGNAATPSEKLTVEEYLERCDAGVGEEMIRFGLGLPALFGPGSIGDFSGLAVSPEAADDDGDLEPEDREEVSRRIHDLSAYHRRRYRRWFDELFRMAPQLPLGGRLVVLNLTIQAAAGGLWDEPKDWLGELADVACSLSDAGADSDIDEEARKSSALIALLVLDAHIERHAGSDPARLGFDRVASSLRDRPLAEPEDDGLERRAATVLSLFGRNIYPGDIAEVVDRVAHPPSELERAVSTLSLDFGISAQIENGALELEGFEQPLRDPLLIALACVETDARAVASIATAVGKVSAIWERPELLVLRGTPRGLVGDLYRLPGGLRLPIPGASSYELPKASCSWMPGEPVPEAAERLLSAMPASQNRSSQAERPR